MPLRFCVAKVQPSAAKICSTTNSRSTARGAPTSLATSRLPSRTAVGNRFPTRLPTRRWLSSFPTLTPRFSFPSYTDKPDAQAKEIFSLARQACLVWFPIVFGLVPHLPLYQPDAERSRFLRLRVRLVWSGFPIFRFTSRTLSEGDSFARASGLSAYISCTPQHSKRANCLDAA